MHEKKLVVPPNVCLVAIFVDSALKGGFLPQVLGRQTHSAAAGSAFLFSDCIFVCMCAHEWFSHEMRSYMFAVRHGMLPN